MLGFTILLCGRVAVFDPVVMNAGQYFYEAFGDAVQVFEGQLAMVQLAVREDLVHQMLHQALNSGRRRIIEGTRSGFHDIGQHHQPGLLGLGPGARIAEVAFIYGFDPLELLRFDEEIAD